MNLRNKNDLIQEVTNFKDKIIDQVLDKIKINGENQYLVLFKDEKSPILSSAANFNEIQKKICEEFDKKKEKSSLLGRKRKKGGKDNKGNLPTEEEIYLVESHPSSAKSKSKDKNKKNSGYSEESECVFVKEEKDKSNVQKGKSRKRKANNNISNNGSNNNNSDGNEKYKARLRCKSYTNVKNIVNKNKKRNNRSKRNKSVKKSLGKKENTNEGKNMDKEEDDKEIKGKLGKDEPAGIVNVGILTRGDKDFYCEVKWKKGKNGKQKENSYFKTQVFGKLYPEMLIKYYESNIVFAQEVSK